MESLEPLMKHGDPVVAELSYGEQAGWKYRLNNRIIEKTMRGCLWYNLYLFLFVYNQYALYIVFLDQISFYSLWSLL